MRTSSVGPSELDVTLSRHPAIQADVEFGDSLIFGILNKAESGSRSQTCDDLRATLKDSPSVCRTPDNSQG